MKVEKICGNCDKINMKRKKTNFYGIPTYECIQDCKYHKLDESGCKYHSFAKAGWTRTGFWIITAVAKILELDSDSKDIKLLFDLLFEYRTTGDDNKSTLFDDYDQSGRLVAENLLKAENKEEYATQIYNFYFIPIILLISDNKKEEALKEFFKMTEELKQAFNITSNVDLIKEGENITMGNNELLKINSILDIDNTEDFNILFNYIKNSTDDIKALYVEICDALKGLLDNQTSEEDKVAMLRKYYNSSIMVAIQDAKNPKSDHSSIKNIFGTMLLRINCEFNSYRTPDVTRKRVPLDIKASSR